MKKKILFSITSQFGYHIGTYKYCKYIDKSKYEVHYVGFDIGLTHQELDDVQVHYIIPHKNKIKRYWYYLTQINKLIRKENFDLLFLVDCQGSIFIRVCNLFRKTIMDVRTGDIRMKENDWISFFNIKVFVSSIFFKHITILSNNLGSLLCLPKKKCHLLPLGAEKLDLPNKSFEKLNLFYIGSLNNRNIYQTIEGLSIFIKKDLCDLSIQYDIVGQGGQKEEEKLIDCIEHYQMNNIVKFHGRKHQNEIINIFEKANLGVVYIPITKGYNYQPTTKLYEYLLAGIPVIATQTLENELAITPSDGVLIQDTPEAFALGLAEFLMQKKNFNSQIIKQKYKNYTWENIVKYNLEPYLDQLC